jgi:hypothetical protein
MSIYIEARDIKENLIELLVSLAYTLCIPAAMFISLFTFDSSYLLALEFLYFGLRSFCLVALGILLSPVYAVEFIVDKFKAKEGRVDNLETSAAIKIQRVWREYSLQQKVLLATKKSDDNFKSFDHTISGLSKDVIGSEESYAHNIRIAKVVDELNSQFSYHMVDKDWSSTTSFSSDQAAASKNSVATYAEVLKHNLL